MPGLNSLALRSLTKLFDPEHQLFCRRIALQGSELFRDQVSPRRTAIALLGLQRVQATSGTNPFDVTSMTRKLLQRSNRIKSIGDQGLLFWLAAFCAPEHLEILCNNLDEESVFRQFSGSEQESTLDLAWFLAGLAHVWLTCPDTFPYVADLALETYQRLRLNQSEDGIFRSRRSNRICSALSISRFGNLTDQAFSIYALAKFGQAFQIEEPLGLALECASALCGLQGEMGQWWWLYDGTRNCVISKYPVLSMYQDGIVPMALLALRDATGQDFSKPIFQGLSWVCGANELGEDLREPHRALIWDSISFNSNRAKYRDSLLRFFGLLPSTGHSALRICYEARPDHFGWLLHAFGQSRVRESASAVRAARP